jgi:hypothetical protein
MSSQRKFYAREKTFSELREREIKVKDNLLEVEVKIMQKITKDTKVFNPLPLHIVLATFPELLDPLDDNSNRISRR